MSYRDSMTTRATLLIACLLALGGCPDETVTHTRIVKAPEAAPAAPGPSAPMPPSTPAAARPQAPMAGGPGMGAMAGDVPAPPKPSGTAKLDWTLPKGWTQTLTGGIRFATLTPPTPGNLDASVVVLAGPAGGELANVNRWRSQIGLQPLDEGALPQVRKSLSTKAGSVSLYDFTSEGTQKSRVVAGLVESNDNTWFFKMTGDAQAVGKALPDFMQLLQSLHASAGAN
jgi:hypothetical protein